ncbi:MAG: DUF1553 domain-containing protein, partial [Planctomycetaceae bacterium]|nr:DUF1553 domain-containing protein [Planctomycetaceae bacterium]
FLGGGAFPTQLTEAEFESARYDELDDMVSTTGVAFLGLSLGCARCHDHKFDPIPSEDYYRMAATFTTVIRSEKEFDLIPEKNLERRQQFQDRLTQLTHELQTFEKEVLPGRFRGWLARSMTDPQLLSDWDILSGTVTTSAGTKFQQLDDGSFLAQGQAPSQEVVTFTAETQRTGIVAFRLEALTHESLPHKGPGRAGNGNFALGNITITVAPVSGGDAKAVKLVAARATHQQNDGALSVAASIDDDPISGWAVDGQIGQDQAAVFVAEHPLEIDTKSRLTITLTFNHPNGQHQVGRFRFSVGNDASAEPQGEGGGPGPAVREALAKLTADSEGAGEAWQTAIDWYKTTLPEWQAAHQAVEEYQEKGPGIELTKVLVATEGLPHLPHHADGRGFPHFYPETYLLRRGDVEQKDRIVEQGFVQVLMRDDRRSPDWAVSPPESWDRTSFRRTGLANWMTDVDHGAGALAARVMANRLWQHHFGRGIVSTPNDFGASGEPPTHPDLLEWLAGNLISHDWKLKPVHKLIMSSSTYLQSNDFDERRAERDRENLTYWRREPLRLEAEAIRDSMLSVAGELDRTMFGPGTLDQNMKRRSVYFFIKRSQLIPMMMLFDWPEHLVSIGQRATTTIAPQALMFMNSPQGRQYAQAFAGRLPTDDPPAAVEMAYQIAFGRPPSTTEKSLSLEFLEAQRKLHDAEGGAGPSRLALTDLCQTLMSMNEFVYVE